MKLLSMPNCRQCTEVKLLLADHNLVYEEELVDDANQRQELRAHYHVDTFPILLLKEGHAIAGTQAVLRFILHRFALDDPF